MRLKNTICDRRFESIYEQLSYVYNKIEANELKKSNLRSDEAKEKLKKT